MTTQEKREKVNGWIMAGKWTVSPMQAAPIIGMVNPYGLNVAAKQQHLQPEIGVFHGRNLRINVSWLSRLVELEEQALKRAGGTA